MNKFEMNIEDIFQVKTPSKVVVVGTILKGSIQPNTTVYTFHNNTLTHKIEVEAIEQYGKSVTIATENQPVALLLVGVEKSDLNIGDIIKSKSKTEDESSN